MKSITIFILFTLFGLFQSCSKQQLPVAVKKELNILILGNSILKHGPAPNIGWHGDWGMAASAPDKDFIHIYNKLLQVSDRYNYIDISSKNIAGWENNFSFNLNEYVDLTAKSYDLMIVRLGENVRDTTAYSSALTRMINLFKNENTQVIITGIIWENNAKEQIHELVAANNDYKFISFEEFRGNADNYSWGIFDNLGVAAHPSDVGMHKIASLLYNATIQLY